MDISKIAVTNVSYMQHDLLKQMYRAVISYLDNKNEYIRGTRKYEGKTYFTYRRQDYSSMMMMPMSADNCTPTDLMRWIENASIIIVRCCEHDKNDQTYNKFVETMKSLYTQLEGTIK